MRANGPGPGGGHSSFKLQVRVNTSDIPHLTPPGRLAKDSPQILVVNMQYSRQLEQCSVELPPELEQSIFEIAAQNADAESLQNIMLVARHVYQW